VGRVVQEAAARRPEPAPARSAGAVGGRLPPLTLAIDRFQRIRTSDARLGFTARASQFVCSADNDSLMRRRAFYVHK
jgi:hypothetical protein